MTASTVISSLSFCYSCASQIYTLTPTDDLASAPMVHINLATMDDQTARLVLQLHAEDLESLWRDWILEGKQRDDDVEDFEFALQVYKAELESTAASLLDSSRDDGAIDDGILKKLSSLNLYGPVDDMDEAQPESSAQAASRHEVQEVNQRRQCVACLDHHAPRNLVRAPCCHEYCHQCLVELFTRSLTDESLFPPRCCTRPIPANDHHLVLSQKLVGEYQAKKVEMETPNRTYCHHPDCATFIPPQFTANDVGSCPRCARDTCTVCKKASHAGDCPEDPATQEMLQFAAAHGWQRCHSCHRLVELTHGCNHISKAHSSPWTLSRRPCRRVRGQNRC